MIFLSAYHISCHIQLGFAEGQILFSGGKSIHSGSGVTGHAVVVVSPLCRSVIGRGLCHWEHLQNACFQSKRNPFETVQLLNADKLSLTNKTRKTRNAKTADG